MEVTQILRTQHYVVWSRHAFSEIKQPTVTDRVVFRQQHKEDVLNELHAEFLLTSDLVKSHQHRSGLCKRHNKLKPIHL